MGVSTIPASGGGGLQPRYQKFTSSGTFTLPDGYGAANPLLINIQVIGGGGGGSPARATVGFPNPVNVYPYRTDYFGDHGGPFPANIAPTVSGTNLVFNAINLQNGKGGGSGGIAATQMSLTSNLTITVGAAGSRPASTTSLVNQLQWTSWGRGGSNNTGSGSRNLSAKVQDSTTGASGGTGGTSTAGAVSAVGGAGGTGSIVGPTATFTITIPSDVSINSGNTVGPFNSGTTYTGSYNSTAGTAGQPAGSVGDAVPLLGALAGGSGTTTPVYGAFGVSGKKGDEDTHTGVEGTGGGFGAIGASGAVIITYWA